MAEKEYIERDAAVAFLENMAASMYLIQCFESKEKFPTADVVEVRHGEWLERHRGQKSSEGYYYWNTPITTVFVCSECGRCEDKREPYCNCGAKMYGKGER